jgi:hypothetical protein
MAERATFAGLTLPDHEDVLPQDTAVKLDVALLASVWICAQKVVHKPKASPGPPRHALARAADAL